MAAAGGQAGAAAQTTSSWISTCTPCGRSSRRQAWGREGREERGVAVKNYYSLTTTLAPVALSKGEDRRIETDVETGKKGSSRKVFSVCF